MKHKIKQAIRTGINTRNEIAECVGIGRKRAEAVLGRMVRDGILKRIVKFAYKPYADGHAIEIASVRTYAVCED